MIVQFKSPSRGVRNNYRSFRDEHNFNNEEMNEIIHYSNISKEFEYNDWFGNSTIIKCTLLTVEKTAYNDLLFTIKTSVAIPKHYVPTPSDILRDKNLLFPVSYSRI